VNTVKSMHPPKPSLAVLDWGIGGMGFYRLFKESYPDAGICYLSDSGSTPYGKQKKEELLQRLERISCFLKSRGITHLVVACNAMSTILPFWHLRKSDSAIQVTGVILPTLSAIEDFKDKKIGVVGGRRTVLSGAYSRPLRKTSNTVTQRIAQPLSALIEKGEKDTIAFKTELKKIMQPLIHSNILLLACTHYPAAIESFKELVPNAVMIDPAYETLHRIVSNWNILSTSSSDQFYTTGDIEEMRVSSHKAFGVEISEINHVEIE